MSGKRFFLDTNAIVALLKRDNALHSLIYQAKWVGISVISYLEFFSYPEITANDKNLFGQFLNFVDVINIVESERLFIDTIIKIRKSYSFKLPDAIILASAIYNHSTLVTKDKQLMEQKIVKVIDW